MPAFEIPAGLEAIKATYGNPEGYLRTPDARWNWMHRILGPVPLPFTVQLIGQPTAGIFVHRKAMTVFLGVFQDLKTAGLEAQVQELNGTYDFSAKRSNPAEFSIRTWGAAIELNLSANPMGGASAQDARVVEIFKARGFLHGADFTGVKEPALFQLATGYEG